MYQAICRDGTQFRKVVFFSIFTINSNLKCGFISTKENVATKVVKLVYRTELFPDPTKSQLKGWDCLERIAYFNIYFYPSYLPVIWDL